MSLGSRFLAVRPGLQYPAYRAATLCAQALSNLPWRADKLLASDTQILIILGAGRSGNTLLRRLLMERGSIFIPPESYVWSSLVKSGLLAPALRWQDRVALVLAKFEYSPEFDTFDVVGLRGIARQMIESPPENQSIGEILRCLYFGLSAHHRHPVAWIGEKTPMNLARIGLVSRMFPNAKYVYLQRDGVDVAASYRAAGIYSSLEAGARRWVDSHAAWRSFRRRLDADRFVELTYEDLTKRHEAVVREVLTKFGIPIRQAPIDVQHLLGDVPKRSHHAQVSDESIRASSRDARGELTIADKERLRIIFGRALVQAGYEPI